MRPVTRVHLTMSSTPATQRCAFCRDLLVIDRDDVLEPAQPLCREGVVCSACALHVRRYRAHVAAFARHGMVPPAPGATLEARRDVYGNLV